MEGIEWLSWLYQPLTGLCINQIVDYQQERMQDWPKPWWALLAFPMPLHLSSAVSLTQLCGLGQSCSDALLVGHHSLFITVSTIPACNSHVLKSVSLACAAWQTHKAITRDLPFLSFATNQNDKEQHATNTEVSQLNIFGFWTVFWGVFCRNVSLFSDSL